MEGSGIGGGAPAAAAAGQVAGQADGQAAEQQAQTPDLAQIAQQMQAMQSGQEDLRQFLSSQPWQQQAVAAEPQTPAEPEPLDLSFLDIADPNFDPQLSAERLHGLIEQTIAQRADALVSQHVQPLQEQVQQERIAREANQLVDEFPEMGDPDIGPQVVAAARQTAEAYGQPELGEQPWFWRMTYMAGRAAQTAHEEGAETPPAAHLEGGAGARPGAQQVDPVDQIFAAGSEQLGRRALPFH